MRRLLLALAALLTTAAATAAVGSAGAPRLQLTESAGVKFPERAYLLTLPQGQRLKPSQVSVRENGTQIRVSPALFNTSDDIDRFLTVAEGLK